LDPFVLKEAAPCCTHTYQDVKIRFGMRGKIGMKYS